MKHAIKHRPSGRWFRERTRGDTTTPFWTYHPHEATVYPTKADAEAKRDAICSMLTRHETYAVPAPHAMGAAA